MEPDPIPAPPHVCSYRVPLAYEHVTLAGAEWPGVVTVRTHVMAVACGQCLRTRRVPWEQIADPFGVPR